MYLKLNYHLSRDNFIPVNKILLKLEELYIDEEYAKLTRKDSKVKVSFVILYSFTS